MSAQINQKVFLGIVLVLLSFSADVKSDAIFIANTTNVCLGAAASAEYTLNYPGAMSIACSAACSAAFIEGNAVLAANATSCAAITAQVLAGNNIVGNCQNVAINACAIMANYVNATQNDVNTLLLAACVGAELGSTGCNAAYSIAYIACNIAYTNYWIGCNIALQGYATVSLAAGASSDDCDAAYATVRKSCDDTAQTTHQSCVQSAITAQASCT